MDSIYQINPELDIPIYRQLVDAIRTAVKKGQLLPNQQLPTVQELSEKLGVARGTVKRVYDELEREGLIEKVQGRGTFVCYRPASASSRKKPSVDRGSSQNQTDVKNASQPRHTSAPKIKAMTAIEISSIKNSSVGKNNLNTFLRYYTPLQRRIQEQILNFLLGRQIQDWKSAVRTDIIYHYFAARFQRGNRIAEREEQPYGSFSQCAVDSILREHPHFFGLSAEDHVSDATGHRAEIS